MQRTHKLNYPTLFSPAPPPPPQFYMGRNRKDLEYEFSIAAAPLGDPSDAASSLALRPGPQRARITVASV